MMITLSGLSKNYVTPNGMMPALVDINLTVNRGEIFGIIGKSGAGKSTLIRCVNLLEKPEAGRVIVNGDDLMSLSPSKLRLARRKIGMIFQGFNLLSSRTVYDNVALPLELDSQSPRQIQTTVMPLLELTGLASKRNAYPRQLSGGQKQRVAIARALACQPTVLLSDEATSALDPQTTQTILELLKNIRDTLGVTILLITHEMAVIKSCCDRVAILDHGKIVEKNEVGEFFSHPRSSIAREFVLSTLHQALPAFVTGYLLMEEAPHSHPLIRFWFLGSTATSPIISQLITQFGLKVNILQSHVEYVKQHIVGVMTVALDGEKDQLQASQQYLKSIGVSFEVIGYVPNDVISFI